MNEWDSPAHSQVTGVMEHGLKKRDTAPFMSSGTFGWGLWVGCSTDIHHVGVGPRQPGASSQLSFTTGRPCPLLSPGVSGPSSVS